MAVVQPSALAAPPSGAAGGDLTGTYPNPTIGAQKVTASKLADPGTGKVWGSDGAGNAAGVFPPGHVYAYVQNVTPATTLAVSASAAAPSDLSLSSGALVFAAQTALVVTFSGILQITPFASGNGCTVSLYKDALNSGGRYAVMAQEIWSGDAITGNKNITVQKMFRFTQAAATVTFLLGGYATNADCSMLAGDPSGGFTLTPAYICVQQA